MNIVVFCPSLIGDTVMATPTFRALRKHFPAGRLTAVVKPNVAPVLDGLDWFDETILFHPRSKLREQRTPALVRRLRADRPDAAVLLPNSIRTAWISRLSGIKRRVGYERYARGWLLTDRLAPPRDAKGKLLPCPIVEYYLALAHALGCPGDGVRLELATTPADEAAADEALATLGVDVSSGLVCLNNGGAFGPSKAWPVEYFGVLARRLAEEAGVAVVALCGPSEREESRRMAELAAHPKVVSLADRPLSLGLSKALVRRADLLVTTDSGPRHFAAAFGTPVVTLFGPTRIEWTRTNHPHAIHLYHPVPCGPCQRPVCPLGHHRCMKLLTPDRVFDAATRTLTGRRSPRSTHLRLETKETSWRPG
ncbi:lipopolysaccharide heptosyltransferase II [Planctomyces sp. SH-PL62]|uniref:lipopolysaccharide heptosyltransferase II n=1 Tax=Planctomyces sp. SH-PL62 TaxID=1636152 RepID=UPI00078DFB67|nr:lipopolysaccharide heptosyltransferase II [Planctomyces sp. SH-PL62]AMV39835.1 ADP-heptose--LPS heptosyltransferase 2 [Planctomyces sp. SH-PL62]